MCERFRDLQHRAGGNALRHQFLRQRPGLPRGEQGRQRLMQGAAVRSAVRNAAEAGVVGQFRPAERRAQSGELPVVADGDEDRPPGRLEQVVGGQVRVRVAGAPRAFAAGKPVGAVRAQQTHRGVEQRDLHHLAAARTGALDQRHRQPRGGV